MIWATGHNGGISALGRRGWITLVVGQRLLLWRASLGSVDDWGEVYWSCRATGQIGPLPKMLMLLAWVRWTINSRGGMTRRESAKCKIRQQFAYKVVLDVILFVP